MKKRFLLSLLMIALSVSGLSAYDFEVDGIYYKILSDTTVAVTYEQNDYASSYVGDIIIPETVTNDNVEYTVTRIGVSAFRYGFDVHSVQIPNTVTVIEGSAFWDCANMVSVNIPNSVTRIDSEAFFDCISLTSLSIPNSVEYIGGFALFGCGGSATSITVASDNPKYDSRNNCNAVIETATNILLVGSNHTIIPDSITRIAEGAFWACRDMTQLELPQTVTEICDYAFGLCEGLTDIIIPENVTSIGLESFWGCSGLTSVDMGPSMSYIGSWAFEDCENLTSVTCRAVRPPYVQEGVFQNKNGDVFEQATVYVPQESLEAYRADEEWGKFTHIVPFIGAGPGDVNGDGNISISDVTGLVDQLLSGGDLPAWMDVNGDGNVSIKDITDLIDMLLAGGL